MKKNTTVLTAVSVILGLTAEKRETMLKTTVTTARKAQKIAAKILHVAKRQGDFADGEMNAYSQRVTGIELRRELQGTYECVNVLDAMHAGKIDFTEGEFDDCPAFAAIILSGLLSKAPEKVAEAIAIIRSGDDVTKRLQALKKGEKPAPEEKPKGAGGGEGESEISTPPVNADTFVIPHSEYVTNHKPLVDRIIAEIKHAEPEDLTVLANAYGWIVKAIAARQAEFAAEPAKAAA